MGYHRDMYEATGNPWYAWEEYRECRRQGRIPADWVLHYFDESARAVHDLGVSASQTASPGYLGASREKFSKHLSSRLGKGVGIQFGEGAAILLFDANITGTS